MRSPTMPDTPSAEERIAFKRAELERVADLQESAIQRGNPTMPDTLYALTARRIEEELTRLRELGYAVSLDCEERWLVATDRDGASSIIARLEEPHDA